MSRKIFYGFYLIDRSEKPLKNYVVLNQGNIEETIKLINKLAERMTWEDFHPKENDVIKGKIDYKISTDYGIIGSEHIYIELDQVLTIRDLFNTFKRYLDQTPSLKYIIYERQPSFDYVIYQYDNPTRWDLYKVYQNDMLDDQFKLINANIPFELNNNIISIKNMDKLTFSKLASIFSIMVYDETGFIPIKSYFEKVRPIYSPAPIDYVKMVNNYPELTRGYLERHLDLLPSVVPLIINEAGFLNQLADLIALYINTYPDSIEMDKMYYYLASIEEGRPGKEEEDKINRLYYLMMVENDEGVKSLRKRLFSDLIGLPFDQEIPFDINLDLQTLINLGRYAVNRR